MQIQPYDILLYKGTSIIGKLIELVTHSQYSHCGLSVCDFHIAEALSKGIEITHSRDIPTGYDIYRYINPLTDEQKQKLHEFIYLKIATKYNFEELFSALLQEEYGIKFPVVKGKLICSQFVFLAYKYINVNLLPDLRKGEIVTPGDLSTSKLLVKISD